MVSGSELGLAALAAFGASEATGVTNVTGLGGGGDERETVGEGGGPPVDLSGLRAEVAGLRANVNRPDSPDVSTFADALEAGANIGVQSAASVATGGGQEPVTRNVGAIQDAFIEGVQEGARDQAGEYGPGGGGDRTSGRGAVAEFLADPVGTAEEAGETTGRTPVAFGGGLASELGGAPLAVSEAYYGGAWDASVDAANKLVSATTGGETLPSDASPRDALDAVREGGLTLNKETSVSGLLNMDGPTDSSSSASSSDGIGPEIAGISAVGPAITKRLPGSDSNGSDSDSSSDRSPNGDAGDFGYGSMTARIAGSDSEAEAGGDPAGDTSDADAPDPSGDRMDRFREKLDSTNGSRRRGVR